MRERGKAGVHGHTCPFDACGRMGAMHEIALRALCQSWESCPIVSHTNITAASVYVCMVRNVAVLPCSLKPDSEFGGSTSPVRCCICAQRLYSWGQIQFPDITRGTERQLKSAKLVDNTTIHAVSDYIQKMEVKSRISGGSAPWENAHTGAPCPIRVCTGPRAAT